MNFSSVFLWIARIWAMASIAFLLTMIFGHIFGNEPQHFTSAMQMVVLAFFPGGVLIGNTVGIKWQKAGGAITVASILIFYILVPNAIGGIWFALTAMPGLLFLIYGFFLKK